MEGKKVGIWIRVSTEDQAQGDSPEHHEKRARMYAESRGWQVETVYHLEAISGKSVMEVYQTKQMLADIKSKRITGLIFSKLARLARNVRELLDFSDLFRENNADLISLQESIDTSTPAGRLFYTVIAAMAQWEREEIADRVKASVPIRAKLGKPLGGSAPYGYRWNNKELALDEKEAPIRRLMFELFAEHKRKNTVSRMLNEKGFRTRNGSKFTDTTVGRLLRDTMAKGQRIANYTKSQGKGKGWILKPESEWVVTPCPSIVSNDLWEECKCILDEQEKTNLRPTRKAVHLFTGILLCDCGSKMYVPSNSRKYVCLACHKNRIETSDMEEIYFEHLKIFLLTPDYLRAFLSKADSVIESKEEQIKILKQESASVKEQMDKLMQLYYSNEIPKEGFNKYYNPLHEQLEQIEKSIPDLQGEIDYLKIDSMNGDHILYEAKSICDKWPSLEPEGKREIIEQLTSSITLAGEDIRIKFSYNPSLLENPTVSPHNFRDSYWPPA